MAEYIASLPMELFVMGFDHNAPDAPFLQARHFPFYETFRRLRPEVKILLVSHPTYSMCDPWADRHQIVLDTYERAKAAGDEKVWFFDGRKLFGNRPSDDCTVDGAHPNDTGMARMAEALEPILRELVEI